MTPDKSLQPDIPSLPHVPSQEEFDWLLDLIEEKDDPLYSVVFTYQLIELLLRVLVIKRTGKPEKAETDTMEELVNAFDMAYIERGDIVKKIRRWKGKRNVLIHSVFFEGKFDGPGELDQFITATAEEGENVFAILVQLLRKGE